MVSGLWSNTYSASQPTVSGVTFGSENQFPAALKPDASVSVGQECQRQSGRTTLGDISNTASHGTAADKGKTGAAASCKDDSRGLEAESLPASKAQQPQRQPLSDITTSFLQQPNQSALADLAAGPLGSHQQPEQWYDIDALNADNPQACAAYAQQIFYHLREAELSRRPDPGYLETVQPDMNGHMRSILVDWLVEVAEEYKLCSDTLFQAVNYVDRFLSLRPVPRTQIQLVGVAAMWVAAKYEEIYAPSAADFVFITDSSYSREALVAAESELLSALGWQLTVPTAKTFLRRFLQACDGDEQVHYLSSYLAELHLLDERLLTFLPSQIAAASLLLAQAMLRRPTWSPTLQHYSGYAPRQLQAAAEALAGVHAAISSSTTLQAMRDKYSAAKFMCVAALPPLKLTPAHFGP